MGRKKEKRFTVTLPIESYEELKQLADSQNPPLTLQYLVNHAINSLLEESRDPQLSLGLGFNPDSAKK